MFKEMGLFYRPASLTGWAATGLALAFCAHIIFFFASHAHSVTDMLYGMFPFVAPTLLGLYVLAMRTAQSSERGRT